MNNLNRFSQYILFGLLITDFAGFSISATLFPNLLLDEHSNFTPGFLSHEERLLAVPVLFMLYPLGQFFSGMVFGNSFITNERKKFFVVSLAGILLMTIFSALAISLKIFLLLFTARFFSGLFIGNISLVQSGRVGICNAATKTTNISLLQLSLGFAWILGTSPANSLLNNEFIEWFNLNIPLWFIAVLFAAVLVVTCCRCNRSLSLRDKYKYLVPTN